MRLGRSKWVVKKKNEIFHRNWERAEEKGRRLELSSSQSASQTYELQKNVVRGHHEP